MKLDKFCDVFFREVGGIWFCRVSHHLSTFFPGLPFGLLPNHSLFETVRFPRSKMVRPFFGLLMLKNLIISLLLGKFRHRIHHFLSFLNFVQGLVPKYYLFYLLKFCLFETTNERIWPFHLFGLGNPDSFFRFWKDEIVL